MAHAEHLKAELIKILDGEPPYDIFVRWKPLHEQPLGWDPDIDDGVRMNIRPFLTARPLNGRGSNGCILRNTPKVKWDKDRGKEPTRDKADLPLVLGLGRNHPRLRRRRGVRWEPLERSPLQPRHKAVRS